MIRHEHLRALGNQNLRRREPLLLDGGQLLEEKLDIQRNARAKHVDHAGRAHAAGQKMEGKAAIIIDDGMTGVPTALKTNHNVGLGGQHIGDLALALVAPVGAYDRFYHNCYLQEPGFATAERICLIRFTT